MASEEASTSAAQNAESASTSVAAATATEASTPAPPAAETAPLEAEASSSSAAPAATPAPKKKATKNYSTDPALYIYTSLTAGNMHIVTATSRLETILRANRVPFKAVDLATDQKARMLWGRRSGKAADGRVRKLPGLVQMGVVLGVRCFSPVYVARVHVYIPLYITTYQTDESHNIQDLVEIEEWNEYGELKQHVKIYYDEFTQPAKGSVAPVPKYKQPANKAAHPPAALNPPPPPERKQTPAEEAAAKMAAVAKSAAQQAAATAQSAKKSVAEEAATKAKQLRLQALREKVQSAKKDDTETTAEDSKKEGESSSSDATESLTKEVSQLSVATGAGLQSPTTGAWKASETSGGSIGAALRTVQSPTTSSWKPPAETSLAAETFAGARVESASTEEIKQVENDSAIKEEPEPEEDKEEVEKAEEEKEKA